MRTEEDEGKKLNEAGNKASAEGRTKYLRQKGWTEGKKEGFLSQKRKTMH